jgi:hypothetical protein
MADVLPQTPSHQGEILNAKDIILTRQLFQSTQEGLTAKAGGGQAGATPITSMCARFTTVATTLDSAILPTATPGLEITIINAAAANTLNVYPDVGSTMNIAVANTPLPIPAGKTAIFFTTAQGSWHSILTA